MTAVADDPLAPVSGQFALTGSRSVTQRNDRPSPAGVRPWGLRRAERATSAVELPLWRYDQARQLAVACSDGRPLVDSPLCGAPTAKTTASTDGEDPPSSEDWIND